MTYLRHSQPQCYIKYTLTNYEYGSVTARGIIKPIFVVPNDNYRL